MIMNWPPGRSRRAPLRELKIMTEAHYFSSTVRARAPADDHRHGVGTSTDHDHRQRRLRRRRARSRHCGAATRSAVPAGRPRILDLGCGYGTIALAIALGCPGAVIDAVDVNDRALTLCRTTPQRWVSRIGSRCCVPTRPIRPRATTRSGPTRPSGSARRPCTTSCRLGCPCAGPRRRRPPGDRQESRRRHPAALADRPRLRLRARRLRQGLPRRPRLSAPPPELHPTCPVR